MSHTSTYQKASVANSKESKKNDDKQTKHNVQKINEKMEKTTLGDLDVLANLKSDLEKEEKKNK